VYYLNACITSHKLHRTCRENHKQEQICGKLKKKKPKTKKKNWHHENNNNRCSWLWGVKCKEWKHVQCKTKRINKKALLYRWTRTQPILTQWLLTKLSFQKLRKAAILFVMPVCPSFLMELLGSLCTIFRKLDIDYFLKYL
jgi:hypothetical protein